MAAHTGQADMAGRRQADRKINKEMYRNVLHCESKKNGLIVKEQTVSVLLY